MLRREVKVQHVDGKRSDSRWFLGIGLAFAALVLFTFARSYYLKVFFGTPALPARLHFHGVVMTGWIALLCLQTGLAAAGRLRWHRQLGTFGVAWAILVMLVGSGTTLLAASREVRGHTDFAPIQLTVTGLELLQMAFFGVFVFAALMTRRRTDWHGRFMLLTLVCMLPSALSRFPYAFTTNASILIGLDAFIVACVVIDVVRHRRLHPALGWGGAAFVGAFHVAFYAMQTPAWVRFGMRLFG